MAVKKQLVIVIESDGKLNIKTEGFKGTECEEELKPIEKSMGKVTKSEKTNEYYQQNTNQKQQNKNTAK